MNSYSEYHTNNGTKLEIKDLDIVNHPIGFTDDSNEIYRLINFDNKNYLISNSRCYPCSRVYENIDGYRWVDVLIIPNGQKINILNKNSSVRYSFYTLKLFEYLKSFDDIIKFDKLYFETFSENDWFSILERIQFLVRSEAKPNEILDAFQKLKMLNPFQLSIISITDGISINKKDIQNYLLNNNTIPLSIPYISNPSFKFKISDSTNEILETEDFLDFISSLTNEEVKDFFELNFLEDSLKTDNIYPEFKLDILGIKILKRLEKEGFNGNVANNVRNRMSSVNISEKLIREYYKRIKRNLRSIENKIRNKKGFNIVGSLYNESLLYNLIQNAFPNYEVITQYSPDWLGRQRIDIFIEELNLAIEYNGKQHYEPVTYFGGKEGFLKTVERDKMKKKKCKRNGCELIEVKYDEGLQETVEIIKTRYSRVGKR
ncbi:hypothetical protein RBU60_12795 [Mesonia sp. MT50]|uniref:Restriction endonuclease n=1 Tax=Mesonia profundi TaxID=3070998 RepID=A0ABU1A4A2_9FLAO|nr:hypothetical protein [Mesonia profundi]MDQ7918449.1 hypothetical protein [Mesonia profundi]